MTSWWHLNCDLYSLYGGVKIDPAHCNCRTVPGIPGLCMASENLLLVVLVALQTDSCLARPTATEFCCSAASTSASSFWMLLVLRSKDLARFFFFLCRVPFQVWKSQRGEMFWWRRKIILIRDVRWWHVRKTRRKKTNERARCVFVLISLLDRQRNDACFRQNKKYIWGRSGLSTWKYQFSYNHWSQTTLSLVSTWMGDCSSLAWVLLLTLKVG